MSVSSYDPDEDDGRKTFPENPYTHRCTERTVNYADVLKGKLDCTACGARWKLNPQRGWLRTPDPGRSHTQRRKYN